MEGFYRVQIVDPDGKVAGDSGWEHNLITNQLTQYISYLLLSSAGSSFISYIALGSSATAALVTSASSLPGEYAKSLMTSISAKTYTTRTSSTTGDTIQFQAQFASNSLATGAQSNSLTYVGLYATSAANSLMCLGTFTSSTFASNQAINVSYNLVFTASTS
jgi:hypothetical protein